MGKNKTKIIDRRTAWQGKFRRCIITTYVDSLGIVREWESVERVNCKGIVGIVPVTDDKEVLLIRQFRPPVKGYVIEFPAGLSEKENIEILKIPIHELDQKLSALKSEGDLIDLKIYGLLELAKRYL